MHAQEGHFGGHSRRRRRRRARQVALQPEGDPLQNRVGRIQANERRGCLGRVTALAATFGSARSLSDEMRDHWRRIANEEGVHTLLKFSPHHAHALVLPEVLHPGADDEGFQVAAGLGDVVEHPHRVALLRRRERSSARSGDLPGNG
jgi:hypothetical protein